MANNFGITVSAETLFSCIKISPFELIVTVKGSWSSGKESADDSQKGSVPKTIVEPSQAPSSKKADGSSPPLLSTGAKAKRPKTSGGGGGGVAGVGASVKRTTSEMKNDLAPKTMQAGLTGRKLSRDRKKI